MVVLKTETLHVHINKITLRGVLILIAGLFLLSPGALAVSVSLKPLSLAPGEVGTTNLTLDNIASGISGYHTGLRLTVPGIAEITGVSFPAWAGLHDQSGFPGSYVMFTAAALGEPVREKAGKTTLAAVIIKGLKDVRAM